MKVIGLIGGMSWESTVSYYRAINEEVKVRMGGLHSAKIIMVSVDFAEIESLQHQERWNETGVILAGHAQTLQRAGADCVVLCTNTMHKVAEDIAAGIDKPLLHIADATAEQLRRDGIGKVGLLGTAFTMEQAFYRQRLEQGYGIEVLIPDADGRARVHEIIYSELCLGHFSSTSKASFLNQITALKQQGAEAVILGCTEIALLVQQTDTTVPLYDTTALHAHCAVDFALDTC